MANLSNQTLSTFTAVAPAEIATPKPIAPSLTTDALAHVWVASLATANADLSAQEAKAISVKALKAAGIADPVKAPAIQGRFLEDYMGARMFRGNASLSDSERDAVRAVLAKKGMNATKGDIRTLAEESLYTAARVAWMRLKDACLNVTKAARVPRQPDAAAAAAAESKPEEAARPNNPQEVVANIHRQAATLLAYAQKYSVHFKAASPMHAVVNTCKTFQDAIAALIVPTNEGDEGDDE